MMNESIADCIATLRIWDEKDTGSEIVMQADQQLAEDMGEIWFSTLTTNSRLSNILNWLEKEEEAEAFIERILKHCDLR